MQENIKDKYDQFRRDHYSMPVKNAVVIAFGVYYFALISLVLFMEIVVRPFLTLPLETNDERNQRMYEYQQQQKEQNVYPETERPLDSEEPIPHWRPNVTHTDKK
jgi:hypothetical protein